MLDGGFVDSVEHRQMRKRSSSTFLEKEGRRSHPNDYGKTRSKSAQVQAQKEAFHPLVSSALYWDGPCPSSYKEGIQLDLASSNWEEARSSFNQGGDQSIVPNAQAGLHLP